MNTQKQKRRPESIASILRRVVKSIDENEIQASLLDVWGRVVREDIRRHASPVLLKKRELVVVVDSSAWLYEIATKYKEQILRDLRKELGDNAPREIRLKIGRLK